MYKKRIREILIWWSGDCIGGVREGGTELISIYRGNKPGDWLVAAIPVSRVESWGMNFIVQLSDPTLSRPV